MNRRTGSRGGTATLALLLLGLAGPTPGRGQDGVDASPPVAVWREGFETDRASWRQEEADLRVRLLEHDRSDRAPLEGRRSEHFRFVAEGPGSAIYYSLPLPRVPLSEDLEVNLSVRSNQAGLQIAARVVLPEDVDLDTGQKSFVLVVGNTSSDPDRWDLLTIKGIPAAVEEQARILRIQTGRKVSTQGAYLDRLVMNLYGGTGEADIYLDDLSIRPVPDAVIAAQIGGGDGGGGEMAAQPTAVADGPPPVPGVSGVDAPSGPTPPANADAETTGVRLEPGGRLTRDGRPWVPTILDAPGAELEVALPYGFDAVMVDADTPRDLLGPLAARGVALVPRLGLESDDADPADAMRRMIAFPLPGSVAFWHLGHGLGASNDLDARKEQLQRVRDLRAGIRDQRPSDWPKLTTATVNGDLPRYAQAGQGLDLLGVEVPMWGSAGDPVETFAYLWQRRQLVALTGLQTPFWAWVPASAPVAVTKAIWGTDLPPSWGVPRVQPEQARLNVYQVLMAGFRGVGFRADADLTRPAGRALLYELGLLNAEIDLVEPILARGDETVSVVPVYRAAPPQRIDYNPYPTAGGTNQTQSKPFPEMPPHESVRAAVIGTKGGKGKLILVADLAAGAQWQPPQMALNDLKMIIPGAADNAQPYLLSFGGVEVLERKRQPGGVGFTIPEFDTSAMVLLTTDAAEAAQLKAAIEAVRPRAIDMAIKQARMRLETVTDLNGRLARDGHAVDQSSDLIALAGRTLQSALDAQARGDFDLAWLEARRTTRPLRVLMRQHFDDANKAMVAAVSGSRARLAASAAAPGLIVPPTASAALMSFDTLPQHYVWCDWARGGGFGTSLLEGGSFDDATPTDLADAGWTDAGRRDTRILGTVKLVPPEGAPADSPARLLQLDVPDNRAASFLDHPAAAVQTPPIPVKGRQLVRIRVRAKMVQRTATGAGGLIVRDSLGGEQLQFRSSDALPQWTEIVLFRRVPEDGEMTVTLGLAGFGSAQFDDLTVEPLEDLRGLGTGTAGIGTAPATPAAATPTAAAPPPANRRASANRRGRLIR
jgi:hypothetical protein